MILRDSLKNTIRTSTKIDLEKGEEKTRVVVLILTSFNSNGQTIRSSVNHSGKREHEISARMA